MIETFIEILLPVGKTLVFALAAAVLQVLANHAFDHVGLAVGHVLAGPALTSAGAAAAGLIIRSPFRKFFHKG